MGSKRNQTIAIARYLVYKANLIRQLEGISDEDYMNNPIGLDIGRYIDDLMKYCKESTVDSVMCHQEALTNLFGEEYLSILAFMPYDRGEENE